jgi:hypothetical protein
MAVNLIAGRSKVVHAPSPIRPAEPLCSAGRKRDTRTFYRETSAPVTCKNCGPDHAIDATPAVRKPTAKMIEALVWLFSRRYTGPSTTDLLITTSTWLGLEARGLVTLGSDARHPGHELTTEAGETGLAFLIDTKRAVVARDGSWVHAQVEPMTDGEITAALIRFENSRALEAEALAKADAIRRRAADVDTVTVLGSRDGRPTLTVMREVMRPEVEAAAELSYRDQGLVEGTAAMLAEGRGSAIVNLADGGRAWTPVDREGEFDRAARRAPDAVWERPTGALALGATSAGEISDMYRLLTGQKTPAEYADNDRPATLPELAAEFYVSRESDDRPPAPPVTDPLPALNAALTPGEAELLDAVDTTDVVEGVWLASAATPAWAVVQKLIMRNLAYGSPITNAYYLTEVGARLVEYRRMPVAAKTTTVRTMTQVKSGLADALDAIAVDPGSDDKPNVKLTVTRLRRGLVLTSADRAALADLLDTVRRSETHYGRSTAFGAWFDIRNTYRAHFGDQR